jgi:hypothetical protein
MTDEAKGSLTFKKCLARPWTEELPARLGGRDLKSPLL